MKGKKILALTSIFAGVALVGATFAAWAVTDNAGAFNLTISPGSISSDTTTTPVTLSYGQRSYANVGNIVNGTKRQAAVVELQADWEVNPADPTKTATFTGQFSVSLSQTGTPTPKLLDYLKIYVCDDAPTLGTGTLVTALPATANQKLTIDKNTAGNAGVLDVTITRDSDGNPVPVQLWVVAEYVEAASSIVDQLSDQQVTLAMDWGKTGSDVVNAFDEIYYYGPNTDVNVYAWHADKSNNGSWPGKDMTLVRDDGTNKLYKYILPVETDPYVGFLIVRDDETKLTQEDVTLSTWKSVGKPCLVNKNDAWTWDVIPPVPETLTKDYYLVGTFNDWKSSDTFGLEKVKDGEYAITRTFAADEEFKVVSKDGEHWFTDASIWDEIDEIVTLNGDNLKIVAAGSYKITFYLNGENGNHIVPSVAS